MKLEPEVVQKLHDFVATLKTKVPETELSLQVRKWPGESKDQVSVAESLVTGLSLQAVHPKFRFEVEAQGESLEMVLDQLREGFVDEISRYKAGLLMLGEGIGVDSPQYSSYLH